VKIDELFSWTFFEEIKPNKKIMEILINGEEVILAYKTLRDIAAITNKRIIVADTQGITGVKVEIFSIPFKSIEMYSTENAGIIDFNAEVKLFTKIGNFKLKLGRNVDVRKIDRVISSVILNI
jgi:hypothetical protein